MPGGEASRSAGSCPADPGDQFHGDEHLVVVGGPAGGSEAEDGRSAGRAPGRGAAVVPLPVPGTPHLTGASPADAIDRFAPSGEQLSRGADPPSFPACRRPSGSALPGDAGPDGYLLKIPSGTGYSGARRIPRDVRRGALAQLVERRLCMADVRGSTPLGSTEPSEPRSAPAGRGSAVADGCRRGPGGRGVPGPTRRYGRASTSGRPHARRAAGPVQRHSAHPAPGCLHSSGAGGRTAAHHRFGPPPRLNGSLRRVAPRPRAR